MEDNLFLLFLNTDFKSKESITKLAIKLPLQQQEIISIEILFSLLYSCLTLEEKENIPQNITVENFTLLALKTEKHIFTIQEEIISLMFRYEEVKHNLKNSTHLIEIINKEISNIHYSLELNELFKNTTDSIKRPVLQPTFFNLREYLFFILADCIQNNSDVLLCTYCNKYIVNPTERQKLNNKNHSVALHPHCRDSYRKLKDRNRKHKNKIPS